MTDYHTDISVVIVNYNSKDFLLQCLRSIEKAGTNISYEVIVVDNNSTDSPIQDMENQFPDVKFIALKENYGFGKANNIGVIASKGNYILILNPDTIIEEDTFDIMYNYMENHPDVGIAGCKVLNPDGTFQLACRRGFPTPWASFCKLFGLQSIFPKSKNFAKYNQTFRPVDETYHVDAVIGAFMFIRRQAWMDILGFDETFFMYGEDLDLCYRADKAGWKTSFVHSTSIIHYKGVSTRRSSIDELKHFYEAMVIFSRKHYSGSGFFLLLLRIGIFLRSLVARILKNKVTSLIILMDLFSINFSMIIATKIRFGGFFNFPYYAYPTVFIVVSLVMLFSMIAVGEYFESHASARKSLYGLLTSFFFLSSLTYFFNEFAFSRGVVLMTIGFTIALTSLVRMVLSFYDKTKGRDGDKRVAIIGTDKRAVNIYEALTNSESRNTDFVGFIKTNNTSGNEKLPAPQIGGIEYLTKLINDYKIRELIICDSSLSSNQMLKLVENSSKAGIRYHFAQEWDEIITARIINDIAGIEPTIPINNISKFRFRLLKLSLDFLISILSLTIGLPFVFLFSGKPVKLIKQFFIVITGRISIVGIYPVRTGKPDVWKPGITGLVQISKPERLSEQAITKLNNYYLMNYSLSLDFEIILKSFTRKLSGN